MKFQDLLIAAIQRSEIPLRFEPGAEEAVAQPVIEALQAWISAHLPKSADSEFDAGYRARKDLYNLYHVLNHLNLFGGGYLRQAESMSLRAYGKSSVRPQNHFAERVAVVHHVEERKPRIRTWRG